MFSFLSLAVAPIQIRIHVFYEYPQSHLKILVFSPFSFCGILFWHGIFFLLLPSSSNIAILYDMVKAPLIGFKNQKSHTKKVTKLTDGKKNYKLFFTAVRKCTAGENEINEGNSNKSKQNDTNSVEQSPIKSADREEVCYNKKVADCLFAVALHKELSKRVRV